MKKSFVFFGILITAFVVLWAVKANIFVRRPDNEKLSVTTPWYKMGYSATVTESEWSIDPTIPENYVPVPGEEELYMVIDATGKIESYKHREKQSDGSWKWSDVNPNIPDYYEKVVGRENLYRVKQEDGSFEYFLYVRNEDNTYAFVPSDELGIPYYDGTDAQVIASNYENYDGNVYAVHNKETGAKEGYAERVKKEDGTYEWKNVDQPTKRETAKNTETPTMPDPPKQIIEPDSTEPTTEREKEGTYSKVDTTQYVREENGYKITYEKKVINYYKQGTNELIYSTEEEPVEIKRERITAEADKSLIKGTLDEELARVFPTVTYDTTIAYAVLDLLNEERAKEGLNPLTMNRESELYKLACVRAADFATYTYKKDANGNMTDESPMYGTVDEMVMRWNLNIPIISENMFTVTESSTAAEKINAKLQYNESTRANRMAADKTEISIVVAKNNGKLYVIELLTK